MANFFVSYSHKDEAWKDKLIRHLKLLQRHLGTPDDPIEVWVDTNIRGGEDWRRKIFQAMDEAVVAILLVSVDALVSDFIRDEELPYLLTRVGKKSLALLPLIVGPCEWLNEPKLNHLQVRPLEGQPLGAMTDYEAEECLSKFMEDVQAQVQHIKQLPLPPDNPYKGLYTFEERDQDVFFGRETKAQTLCDDLYQNAALCLVGSSGSGKSSLVYAGVVPRLRKDHWLIVPFRPRKDPLGELAQALAELLQTQAGRGGSLPLGETELEDSLRQRHGFLVDLLRSVGTAGHQDRHVLLFVDQFEEIFTNCGPEPRAQFLRALLHDKWVEDAWARGHLRCLLTLRFDFLEQAVHEREAGLGNVLQQIKPQLLGEMGDDQLRDVIERPAQRRGASFERGLVERILRDIGVGNERGKLPLLEFCLQQLWLRQEHLGGRVLTRQAYEDIGGFQGAVTQYADQVFDSFSADEQAAAPALLVHLVNVSTSDDMGGDTRRPVVIEELIGSDQSAARPQGQSLVTKLVDKRLLVKGDQGPGRGNGRVTVELAHEILIQAWQRLKTWVDVDRDFLKKLRHVEVELRNGQLLTGPLLDECECWLNDHGQRLLPKVVKFIERSLVAQAEAQINTLLVCKVATLPRCIEQLKYLPTLAPILRHRLQAERDHEARRRLSLALLTMEDGPVDYLKEQLLLVEPAEYAVICQALEPYRDRLRDELCQVAMAAAADPSHRLRAACALARYDPGNSSWADLASDVAKQLVTENPLHVSHWVESLLPVREVFFGPLGEVCKNPQQAEAERALAATILADFAVGRSEVIADVIVEATAKQYALLWPAIQAHSDRAICVFRQELAREMPAEIQPEARDALARRQAQAAVALLQFGEAEQVWPLLRQGPDPGRRTYLLHAFGPLGTKPDLLLQGLESETDAGVRRALILSLGEFTREQLPDERRNPQVGKLLQWYRDDPDPGVHGAIDWLLRYSHQGKVPRKLDWGQGVALAKIDQQLAGQPPGHRNWYVTREGLTLAVTPGPVLFSMGSPDGEKDRRENEKAHLRLINRRFGIANKPVTVAQFARFQRENSGITKVDTKRYSPTDDCPQTRVTWFEAVAYCNWLSDREGIPREQWCYRPKGDNYIAGMTVAANHLSLSGYRLPTEAEWEFSCRAGSRASRYFGEAIELLGMYAWYNKNAQRPNLACWLPQAE